MIISLNLTKNESDTLKYLATNKGQSISEYIENAVLEKIEDDADMYMYDIAMKAFKDDPVTYTLLEAESEIIKADN